RTREVRLRRRTTMSKGVAYETTQDAETGTYSTRMQNTSTTIPAVLRHRSLARPNCPTARPTSTNHLSPRHSLLPQQSLTQLSRSGRSRCSLLPLRFVPTCLPPRESAHERSVS